MEPRGSVPPEQLAQYVHLADKGTEELDAQCFMGMLLALSSRARQMWARDGRRSVAAARCLPAVLLLLLRAPDHAGGVTCGPCMTKNAGMWVPGYFVGGNVSFHTCSGCVLSLTVKVAKSWL